MPVCTPHCCCSHQCLNPCGAPWCWPPPRGCWRCCVRRALPPPPPPASASTCRLCRTPPLLKRTFRARWPTLPTPPRTTMTCPKPAPTTAQPSAPCFAGLAQNLGAIHVGFVNGQQSHLSAWGQVGCSRLLASAVGAVARQLPIMVRQLRRLLIQPLLAAPILQTPWWCRPRATCIWCSVAPSGRSTTQWTFSRTKR